MKNSFKKISALMAAAVLLSGTVSDVAYAHSSHHGSRKHAATQTVQYASCHQDGVCTQNGSCDVNGVCQNGGYCIGSVYCQDSSLCSKSHHSGCYTVSRSAHHSKRGCGSHH